MNRAGIRVSDGRGSDELLGGYRLCGESALEAAEDPFGLRQDLDLRRVLARLNGDAIPLRRDAILGRSLLVCAATAYACIGLSHAVVLGSEQYPFGLLVRRWLETTWHRSRCRRHTTVRVDFTTTRPPIHAWRVCPHCKQCYSLGSMRIYYQLYCVLSIVLRWPTASRCECHFRTGASCYLRLCFTGDEAGAPTKQCTA